MVSVRKSSTHAAMSCSLSSAVLECLRADAVWPLHCAFGRSRLYVKLYGNRPGGSNHIGQGDRGHGEREVHLSFQWGGMECCLPFPRDCDVFDVEPANGVV